MVDGRDDDVFGVGYGQGFFSNTAAETILRIMIPFAKLTTMPGLHRGLFSAQVFSMWPIPAAPIQQKML